ncbi:MAG TPA: PP2C family protein-serine/threonine phosphatase [Thermoanaerobaculia bacterium]|nr:PP2C family protein-serine/threonine phosphatase [Thermoanaerobaculia bacterium]
MKPSSIDELVQLPEPIALQRHFDARNYRYFRWILALVMVLSVPGMIGSVSGSASDRRIGLMAFFVADLVVAILLIVLRRERFYTTWFRQVLLGFLLLQAVVIKAASLSSDDPAIAFIPVAFALIGFRLRLTEHLMTYLILWLTALLPLTATGLPSAEALPSTDEFASITTVSLICLALSAVLTQVEKKRFLLVWRTEHARSRERLRMREEIEYARKIQLSMLPQLPPDIGWVELAAASLPATEVGGDYYDYFRLSGSQLALVIGDVSGHGLASGLLLSGVRSCLYLLEKDLASPVDVLNRLNPMVRKTTDRRTYVTLLCAVLDRVADGVTLTVASAGHPPVLHWDTRERSFTEVGEGALPLGTLLDSEFRQCQRKVRRGDLLILYTDGLVESRNSAGQDYGYPRLQRTVARAASGNHSVRDIRDSILGDLSHFKGDSEQSDDITVVVARVK